MEQISLNKKVSDANQITRDFFDSLLIEMRHMDGVLPSTKLELYGETFSTPIMTAALSHLQRAHPNGMAEMAKGAYLANAVMWAGMGEDEEMDAMTATGARVIKVIKPYADEDLILRQIEHAEKCGALGLGMDLDHSFGRKGHYDNVLGYPMLPKSMDQIKNYVRATKLPFIIKGVLSEQDAAKCVEAGIRGIVVSHHHGVLDYAVPPLMILPKIVKVIAGAMPIFVDCGIMTGVDAFKALALGATAVSAGRILMESLTAEGAEGIRKAIVEMTEQLAGAMSKTCSPDITHIDPTVIWKRDF